MLISQPAIVRRRRALRSLIVAASLLLLGAWAPAAQAGRYHVYSCRTPAGAVAPVDGWSGSSSGPFIYYNNDCASGGALSAALDGSVSQPANSAIATWTYTAPPHATVAAATLWRYGTAATTGTNAADLFWLATPHEDYANDVFDQCVANSCNAKGVPSPALSPSNLLYVPADKVQGATQLFANAACGGASGYSCPATSGASYGALVRIFAADFTLDTHVVPSVANAVGSMATSPTFTGPQDLSFDASDAGPGLYEVRIRVDGQLVDHMAVSDNGGRCVDAGGTTDGTLAFLYGQPCTPTAHLQETFDSRQVADGVHHLVVSVASAAGNETAVVDRQVSFANGVGVTNASVPRGAANGMNASDQARLVARWASTTRPRLENHLGRVRQITGRLTTSSGLPISGAAIDVIATPLYPGAAPRIEGSARTSASGTWSFATGGAESSRILDFRYRSHVNDSQPAAAAKLELDVHAGVTLRVAPRTVSVGHAITFRGRVLGGPIPRGGKQLVLEARQPGGDWIEFNVVRTNAAGRYRARYRFRLAGPVHYQFRAVSKFEAAFPFIAGASPVVNVFER